jgi:hypothetical protein
VKNGNPHGGNTVALKKLFLVAGMLAVSAIGTSAQAALMTTGDSVAFSFASYDNLIDRNPGLDAAGKHIFSKNVQRQNLSLNRFDASLGTLTQVDIWFDSAWSLGSSVDSVDPRGNKRASAKGRSASKQRVQLLDPNKEVAANNEVLWSTCNDKPSCTASSLTSGVFSSSFDLGAFSLADFIGSDALDFRVVRRLESDLRVCGPFDFCSHKNSDNAWSGNIYVSYTYDLPEPSTLALLGLGLGLAGLGSSRMRRGKI